MKMGGQFHASASFLPRKEPTHWIWGYVGPGAGLDAVEWRKFLAPAWNWTQAFYAVAIPTELSCFS
jgi:hypothetical protein